MYMHENLDIKGYEKRNNLIEPNTTHQPQYCHNEEKASCYPNAYQNMDIGEVIGHDMSSYHHPYQDYSHRLEEQNIHVSTLRGQVFNRLIHSK